jgi:hypothetical protein
MQLARAVHLARSDYICQAGFVFAKRKMAKSQSVAGTRK